MGRISFFFAGLLIGAAAMFSSLKYHVVRAGDGLHLVPKMQSDFSQPYVDVREFTASDWNDHPELAVAIVKADKAHLLQDAAFGTIRRKVDSVLQNLHDPAASVSGGR